MPSREVEEYLRDIIDNIEAARAFIKSTTVEEFRKDRLIHYAVLRALEIVSEASRHLSPEIMARHPGINWRAIADAGNVYRHVYHSVDLQLVWQTVTQFVDPLFDAAKAELERSER